MPVIHHALSLAVAFPQFHNKQVPGRKRYRRGADQQPACQRAHQHVALAAHTHIQRIPHCFVAFTGSPVCRKPRAPQHAIAQHLPPRRTAVGAGNTLCGPCMPLQALLTAEHTTLICCAVCRSGWACVSMSRQQAWRASFVAPCQTSTACSSSSSSCCTCPGMDVHHVHNHRTVQFAPAPTAVSAVGPQLCTFSMPDDGDLRRHASLRCRLALSPKLPGARSCCRSRDGAGRPWATVLAGRPGFLTSPDPQHLTVQHLRLPPEGVPTGSGTCLL